MGKKVREYKAGDFIFAKVKGYPAWPARVHRLNGKKYFVYFYGTGETANLPPTQIFDYAENKDKFLTKTVKRRDFNDGVKQIEYDFANNVPIEEVIGVAAEVPADGQANDTANDSEFNDTMDETADTAMADDTVADESAANADGPVEDSDETGTLVIDEGGQEGKPKGRKPKDAATPSKTPAKPAKEPKTPRGRKKEEAKEREEEERRDDKKEEEIVSRSGRKIRPKRYMDEQTEDNSTLPSPAVKKRRGGSPDASKEKDKPNFKEYNAVPQSQIENLKEPYKSAHPDKDCIMLCWLPTHQYIGVKLFQSRPVTFGSANAALQWERQAATNAIKLKIQLERGYTKPQVVLAQLVMDLNLTDEEKAALDKERETEEKRLRMLFLKTEMKLIELDAKIKSCLCLQKPEVTLCLKLLDELAELDVKPLMLLKHPTCIETVKRMRAYVGNPTSWNLNESEAIQFHKQALKIRKQAESVYTSMKNLYDAPSNLSFWDFFSTRVLLFKKATSTLNADELLEVVHMPPLQSRKDAVNNKPTAVIELESDKEDDNEVIKKAVAPETKAVSKKNGEQTPDKKEQNDNRRTDKESNEKETEKVDLIKEKEISEKAKDNAKKTSDSKNKDLTEKSGKNSTKDKELEGNPKESDSSEAKAVDDTEKTKEKEDKKEKERERKDKERVQKEKDKEERKEKIKDQKEKDKEQKEKDKEQKEKDKEQKEKDKEQKEKDKEQKEKDKEQKEKDKEVDEPRAKRTRENKKNEPPPPRSPAKRKPKA